MTEAVRTCYVDRSIDIISVYFIASPAFQHLMNRFSTNLFTSFPDIPCAYCGILSVRRSTKWLNEEEISINAHLFDLLHILCISLHRDSLNRVAVCSLCWKSPRKCISADPWPDSLTTIPQHSKMFLSPVKLNCNLGRTQSHSSGPRHNSYSTYHTLSDILIIVKL